MIWYSVSILDYHGLWYRTGVFRGARLELLPHALYSPGSLLVLEEYLALMDLYMLVLSFSSHR